MLRIAMWSGPRNISTAMMRSWENRNDTLVVDEPFYGFYLARTGVEHPGKDEVIDQMCTDWRQIAEQLTGERVDSTSIYYQKHMAHHMLPEVDLSWVHGLTHAFLIRHPDEMIPSLAEKLSEFDLAATGLPLQWSLFERVVSATGQVPPVLDAGDVLRDPEGMLRLFCTRLGVPFLPSMLCWPPGRRDSDGPWAQYWYENVEKSTGFGPYRPKNRPIAPKWRAIHTESVEIYEKLSAHRLISRPLQGHH